MLNLQNIIQFYENIKLLTAKPRL